MTNWKVPSARVMRYVRALRASRCGHGAIAVRGRARTSGLDVVIAHDGAHDRRLGRRPARMQRAAVALGAGAVEDYLALLLELVQLGIRVREGRRAGEDRVGQQFDPWRREQRLLESREVVEHARRRFHRHLGVREECAAGLFLKRAEARIVLVAALPVRAVGVLAHDGDARRARRPDRQRRRPVR